jgi:hypothetical protein
MLAVSKALFDTMVADETLTDLLGEYQGEPSIFTKRPVPTGATYPIVLADTVVTDVNADFLNEDFRIIDRDIVVYGESEVAVGGETVSHYRAVEQAAERIRELFHGQRVEITGWDLVDIRVLGPISAPTEADESGRLVTLTLRLHRPNPILMP